MEYKYEMGQKVQVELYYNMWCKSEILRRYERNGEPWYFCRYLGRYPEKDIRSLSEEQFTIEVPVTPV